MKYITPTIFDNKMDLTTLKYDNIVVNKEEFILKMQ